MTMKRFVVAVVAVKMNKKNDQTLKLKRDRNYNFMNNLK